MTKPLHLACLLPSFAILAATGEDIRSQGWQQVMTTNAPGASIGCAMSFDDQLGKVLLFGGNSDGLAHSSTWTFDGAAWLQLPTAHSPSPRGTKMAYDSVRRRAVLFGGWDNFTRRNDTWEWNGSDWVQRQPATSPPGRCSHVMTFDSLRGRVVLFGGRGPNTPAGDTPLADTWDWDGTQWTLRQSPVNPPGRWDCGLAFDAHRGVAVLFGGADNNQAFADTWSWNGTSWTQATPSTNPPPRGGPAMAFDSQHNQVVLFSGFNGSLYLSDTWHWNGQDWVLAPTTTSPLGRWSSSMAFSPAIGTMVLFGGIGSPGSSNPASWYRDTWTYAPYPTVLASATSYGSGCAGSNGVPTVTAANLPVLNTLFRIDGSNLPTYASQLAIGFFGFSNTAWGFYLLPLDLTPQGLPGCQMLASPPPPGLILSTFTQNGTCTWQYQVPGHPLFLGMPLYFQALIPDPQAGNPLGATVTNGIHIVCGL